MKKNVFLWVLMFCATLISTGCGVFAGNEDGLIKTGYYVWKSSKEKNSKQRLPQPIYIESYKNGFDIYNTSGICYHVSIKNDEIIAKSEMGERIIDITGKIISQHLIDGEFKVFSASTGKTTIIHYTIVPDIAPQKDSDYFKKIYQEEQAKYESLLISKTSAYGRKMRAEIEKEAKEENVSFVVKGKVIDSTGHPVEGLIIGLSARMHDPDGPMGMRLKRIYITSNKDGFFESEALSGYLLTILYEGEEYQRVNESLHGKKELLKLKDNPVIIKLEPNAK